MAFIPLISTPQPSYKKEENMNTFMIKDLIKKHLMSRLNYVHYEVYSKYEIEDAIEDGLLDALNEIGRINNE